MDFGRRSVDFCKHFINFTAIFATFHPFPMQHILKKLYIGTRRGKEPRSTTVMTLFSTKDCTTDKIHTEPIKTMRWFRRQSASSVRTTIQKRRIAVLFLPSSSALPSLGGMDIHISFGIELDMLDNPNRNDEPPVRCTDGSFCII